MAWAQSQQELDELKKLAQQRREEAAARKELNQAENRIDVENNQNNVRLDREQMQRQAEHDRNMAARERFAKSHALTAVTDPGRYSPQEVKAARDYLEGRGFGQEGERRRQFNEQQATARIEAANKMRGMVGQGRDAANVRAAADISSANIKSAADKDVAVINAASAERNKTNELAAQKELETMADKTKRYGIDAEHGTADREGSRERVERLRGDSEIAIAEADRKAKQDALALQITQQLGKQAANYDSAYISKMGSIISQRYKDALTAAQRSEITNELREQYKDNPVAMAYIGAYGSAEATTTPFGQGMSSNPPMPLSRTQGGTAMKRPREGEIRDFTNGERGIWRGDHFEKIGTWK